MQVDVKHRLPRLRVAVEDRPEARTVVPALPGDRRARPHHRADEIIFRRRQIVQRRHVLPRHDQHVHRRLRVDVVEGDQAIVLIDLRRGDLARDDLAEQAAHGNKE
jgi:hypothetical protein